MNAFQHLALFALFLLAFLTGCGVAEPTMGTGVTPEDLSHVMTGSDIDGNGVLDVDQSMALGTIDGNAVVIVDPAQKSPEGLDSEQEADFVGYGSEIYSDSPNGWANGYFPAVAAVDEATGELIGYGNSGWRPGNYEVTLASPDSEIGSQDGWWRLELGIDPAVDDLEYLVLHLDGVAGGCERESWHLAFTVWPDGAISPIGYSIAPEDPNCY